MYVLNIFSFLHDYWVFGWSRIAVVTWLSDVDWVQTATASECGRCIWFWMVLVHVFALYGGVRAFWAAVWDGLFVCAVWDQFGLVCGCCIGIDDFD